MISYIVHIDLTITTEKLVELFGTVEEQLVDVVGDWLGLSDSKTREVQVKYQSPTQRRDAYLDLYVNDYPYPSWKRVARALFYVRLRHQGDEVMRTYLQGTIITPTTVLGVVPVNVCVCIQSCKSR